MNAENFDMFHVFLGLPPVSEIYVIVMLRLRGTFGLQFKLSYTYFFMKFAYLWLPWDIWGVERVL